MRRTVALGVAVLLVLTVAAPAIGVSFASRFDKGGQFIVQLADLPVVAYDGSIKGYRATKPAPGAKINPNSAAVTKYVGLLTKRHNSALKQAGGGKKLYDYFYSYNGFLAKMTAKQANRLAANPKVLSVERNQLVEVDTSSTPTFLGLDATDGLWDQLGGPTGTKTQAGAGENVIIGIVDSGIWPESLSFADRDANGKLTYGALPGFHGKCDSAENVIDPDWDANTCNKKLVAAQHFNASWGGDAALEADRPWEFMSPRDYNGHGTHTGSTSGGNYGVETTGPAAAFGSISGMAPRARIAAYKALWSTEDASTASGFTGDLVAAIDQAVHDGVDVINYSISGTRTSFADAVGISFLFAADAGIFVSASAGNSGPGASTVAHPGPWLTTVAAGTHNRAGEGSVTLGNAATYTGASIATEVGPVQIVDSVDVGLAAEDATEVELCYPGTLDPAEVAGKIVLCKRGVIARTDKSLAVEMADGVGMVLYNDPDSSLNADFHFVPTVHVNNASGLAIKAYIAAEGSSATATINEATITETAPAPFTASFSSRGPLLAGSGDILKPDVIAPGVDILAAVAPPGNHGLDFNLYSGTSMSAPHVAGLAALLKDLHPNWSPMAIKSALMTTGYDVLDSTSAVNRIFRQGAGHVDPNSAADPGLVYDSGFLDWLAFLCGSSSAVGAGTCNFLANNGFSLDPSDMNLASIAIGDLAGVQTVTRRVTNVGGTMATYEASVSGLSGIDVVVSPDELTLMPGQTKEFTVEFTRTTATLNEYHAGQLTWTHGPHTVRSPLIIQPVPIAAPALVTEDTTTDSGSFSWDLVVGYDGTLDADAYGAVADATSAEEVLQDPDKNIDTDPFTEGVDLFDFTLGAGTQYWAGGTMEATTEAGSDLDVYLLYDFDNDGFDWDDDLIALSADGDSEEIVQLIHPDAGDYRLIVHGWGTPDGASTYTLHWWDVGGAADGGSLTAEPAGGDDVAVSTAETVEITATYTGLSSVGTQYRGLVDYDDGTDLIGSTVVIINR